MMDPRAPSVAELPYAPPAPHGAAPAPLVPAGGPAFGGGSGPGGAPRESEQPGFGAGVASLFAGLRFVTSTPSVWPLAMVPALLTIAITVAVGFAGYELLPGWIEPMLGPWARKAHGAIAIVVKVLVVALSLVLGAVLGFALSQPLSGPALEKIVRKMEGSLGVAAWPETSLFQDIWRSLEGVLITTALSLPILALLFAIEIIFPPAAIVTMPLKIAVGALMLAWDLCDYPLSIRGMAIRDRVAFLRRHLGAVFGFGLGIALLSLIPCALLLALPFGAAGATKLVVRLERWEKQAPGR